MNEAKDYIGEDGLLYCGKCHTPKQFRDPHIFKGRAMPIPCRCENETVLRRQTEEEEKKHESRIAEMRESGIDAPVYRSCRIENADPKAKGTLVAKRYVAKWDEMLKNNIGCLFWGDVGTGKTYTAAMIANALIDREIPVKMTSFPEIIAHVQGYRVDAEHYYRELTRYPLLIIDDLGAERQSQYALEIVYNVIEKRNGSGKPLIVTTNLSQEDMTETTDVTEKRIFSRVLSMCPAMVCFNGENYRAKAQADRIRLAKSLMAGD